jgi:hypothetical protein
MRREFTRSIRELSRSFAYLLDPYRPELHYMRGPGPKWRAKRISIAAKAAPVVGETGRALHAIAKAHA